MMNTFTHLRVGALLATILIVSCSAPAPSQSATTASPAQIQVAAPAPVDKFSYANPAEIRVTHVALDLDVDFDKKSLIGSATLDSDGVNPLPQT